MGLTQDDRLHVMAAIASYGKLNSAPCKHASLTHAACGSYQRFLSPEAGSTSYTGEDACLGHCRHWQPPCITKLILRTPADGGRGFHSGQ